VFTVLCFSGPIGPPETAKLIALLVTPPTVTTTLPVVAPVGTGVAMLAALQLVAVAATPLNATVLVPCVAPKFAPLIVTDVPTAPDVGLKLAMLGAKLAAVTLKLTPLLATPPTVTTTFPVVAPAGTGATMLVALQLVGVAAVPLNFAVLVPCVAPKFAPAIVTGVPAAPDVGLKLAMLAGGGFPPPGFEFVAPLHPVFVMASASSSIGHAFRRNSSPDVIVFIVKNILSVLRLHAQAIFARSRLQYCCREMPFGDAPTRRIPGARSFGNRFASEKHQSVRSGVHFRPNLSYREGTNGSDRT
jgi:hypothetical protein